jgi:hypothetical protein
MSLQTITLLGMRIGSSHPHSLMPPECCARRRVQNAGRSLTLQPVSTKLLLGGHALAQLGTQSSPVMVHLLLVQIVIAKTLKPSRLCMVSVA